MAKVNAIPNPTTVSKSAPSRMNTDKLVFSADEVKAASWFFIAGRGGETNLHHGNHIFRQRALEHTETYARLKTSQRGRKFARQLLEQHFSDMTFVVRQEYFFKNVEKGLISKEKYLSVIEQHGGSLDGLKDLPADSYFQIGTNWVLGIISDIVRFGAADKLKAQQTASGTSSKPKNKRKSLGFSAIVSDDESSASTEPPSKRARKTKSQKASRRHNTAQTTISTPTMVVPEPLPLLSSSPSVDLLELSNMDLFQLPLPSVEDEAFLFGDEYPDLTDYIPTQLTFCTV